MYELYKFLIQNPYQFPTYQKVRYHMSDKTGSHSLKLFPTLKKTSQDKNSHELVAMGADNQGNIFQLPSSRFFFNDGILVYQDEEVTVAFPKKYQYVILKENTEHPSGAKYSLTLCDDTKTAVTTKAFKEIADVDELFKQATQSDVPVTNSLQKLQERGNFLQFQDIESQLNIDALSKNSDDDKALQIRPLLADTATPGQAALFLENQPEEMVAQLPQDKVSFKVTEDYFTLSYTPPGYQEAEQVLSLPLKTIHQNEKYLNYLSDTLETHPVYLLINNKYAKISESLSDVSDDKKPTYKTVYDYDQAKALLAQVGLIDPAQETSGDAPLIEGKYALKLGVTNKKLGAGLDEDPSVTAYKVGITTDDESIVLERTAHSANKTVALIGRRIGYVTVTDGGKVGPHEDGTVDTTINLIQTIAKQHLVYSHQSFDLAAPSSDGNYGAISFVDAHTNWGEAKPPIQVKSASLFLAKIVKDKAKEQDPATAIPEQPKTVATALEEPAKGAEKDPLSVTGQPGKEEPSFPQVKTPDGATQVPDMDIRNKKAELTAGDSAKVPTLPPANGAASGSQEADVGTKNTQPELEMKSPEPAKAPSPLADAPGSELQKLNTYTDDDAPKTHVDGSLAGAKLQPGVTDGAQEPRPESSDRKLQETASPLTQEPNKLSGSAIAGEGDDAGTLKSPASAGGDTVPAAQQPGDAVQEPAKDGTRQHETPADDDSKAKVLEAGAKASAKVTTPNPQVESPAGGAPTRDDSVTSMHPELTAGDSAQTLSHPADRVARRSQTAINTESKNPPSEIKDPEHAKTPAPQVAASGSELPKLDAHTDNDAPKQIVNDPLAGAKLQPGVQDNAQEVVIADMGQHSSANGSRSTLANTVLNRPKRDSGNIYESQNQQHNKLLRDPSSKLTENHVSLNTDPICKVIDKSAGEPGAEQEIAEHLKELPNLGVLIPGTVIPTNELHRKGANIYTASIQTPSGSAISLPHQRYYFKDGQLVCDTEGSYYYTVIPKEYHFLRQSPGTMEQNGAGEFCDQEGNVLTVQSLHVVLKDDPAATMIPYKTQFPQVPNLPLVANIKWKAAPGTEKLASHDTDGEQSQHPEMRVVQKGQTAALESLDDAKTIGKLNDHAATFVAATSDPAHSYKLLLNGKDYPVQGAKLTFEDRVPIKLLSTAGRDLRLHDNPNKLMASSQVITEKDTEAFCASIDEIISGKATSAKPMVAQVSFKPRDSKSGSYDLNILGEQGHLAKSALTRKNVYFSSKSSGIVIKDDRDPSGEKLLSFLQPLDADWQGKMPLAKSSQCEPNVYAFILGDKVIGANFGSLHIPGESNLTLSADSSEPVVDSDPLTQYKTPVSTPAATPETVTQEIPTTAASDSPQNVAAQEQETYTDSSSNEHRITSPDKHHVVAALEELPSLGVLTPGAIVHYPKLHRSEPDIYATNIQKPEGTELFLLPHRYYFKDGQLICYTEGASYHIVIPENYHYLKQSAHHGLGHYLGEFCNVNGDPLPVEELRIVRKSAPHAPMESFTKVFPKLTSFYPLTFAEWKSVTHGNLDPHTVSGTPAKHPAVAIIAQGESAALQQLHNGKIIGVLNDQAATFLIEQQDSANPYRLHLNEKNYTLSAHNHLPPLKHDGSAHFLLEISKAGTLRVIQNMSKRAHGSLIVDNVQKAELFKDAISEIISLGHTKLPPLVAEVRMIPNHALAPDNVHQDFNLELVHNKQSLRELTFPGIDFFFSPTLLGIATRNKHEVLDRNGTATKKLLAFSDLSPSYDGKLPTGFPIVKASSCRAETFELTLDNKTLLAADISRSYPADGDLCKQTAVSQNEAQTPDSATSAAASAGIENSRGESASTPGATHLTPKPPVADQHKNEASSSAASVGIENSRGESASTFGLPPKTQKPTVANPQKEEISAAQPKSVAVSEGGTSSSGVDHTASRITSTSKPEDSKTAQSTFNETTDIGEGETFVEDTAGYSSKVKTPTAETTSVIRENVSDNAELCKLASQDTSKTNSHPTSAEQLKAWTDVGLLAPGIALNISKLHHKDPDVYTASIQEHSGEESSIPPYRYYFKNGLLLCDAGGAPYSIVIPEEYHYLKPSTQHSGDRYHPGEFCDVEGNPIPTKDLYVVKKSDPAATLVPYEVLLPTDKKLVQVVSVAWKAINPEALSALSTDGQPSKKPAVGIIAEGEIATLKSLVGGETVGKLNDQSATFVLESQDPVNPYRLLLNDQAFTIHGSKLPYHKIPPVLLLAVSDGILKIYSDTNKHIPNALVVDSEAGAELLSAAVNYVLRFGSTKLQNMVAKVYLVQKDYSLQNFDVAFVHNGRLLGSLLCGEKELYFSTKLAGLVFKDHHDLEEERLVAFLNFLPSMEDKIPQGLPAVKGSPCNTELLAFALGDKVLSANFNKSYISEDVREKGGQPTAEDGAATPHSQHEISSNQLPVEHKASGTSTSMSAVPKPDAQLPNAAESVDQVPPRETKPSMEEQAAVISPSKGAVSTKDVPQHGAAGAVSHTPHSDTENEQPKNILAELKLELGRVVSPNYAPGKTLYAAQGLLLRGKDPFTVALPVPAYISTHRGVLFTHNNQNFSLELAPHHRYLYAQEYNDNYTLVPCDKSGKPLKGSNFAEMTRYCTDSEGCSMFRAGKQSHYNYYNSADFLKNLDIGANYLSSKNNLFKAPEQQNFFEELNAKSLESGRQPILQLSSHSEHIIPVLHMPPVDQEPADTSSAIRISKPSIMFAVHDNNKAFDIIVTSKDGSVHSTEVNLSSDAYLRDTQEARQATLERVPLYLITDGVTVLFSTDSHGVRPADSLSPQAIAVLNKVFGFAKSQQSAPSHAGIFHAFRVVPIEKFAHGMQGMGIKTHDKIIEIPLTNSQKNGHIWGFEASDPCRIEHRLADGHKVIQQYEIPQLQRAVLKEFISEKSKLALEKSDDHSILVPVVYVGPNAVTKYDGAVYDIAHVNEPQNVEYFAQEFLKAMLNQEPKNGNGTPKQFPIKTLDDILSTQDFLPTPITERYMTLHGRAVENEENTGDFLDCLSVEAQAPGGAPYRFPRSVFYFTDEDRLAVSTPEDREVTLNDRYRFLKVKQGSNEEEFFLELCDHNGDINKYAPVLNGKDVLFDVPLEISPADLYRAAKGKIIFEIKQGVKEEEYSRSIVDLLPTKDNPLRLGHGGTIGHLNAAGMFVDWEAENGKIILQYLNPLLLVGTNPKLEIDLVANSWYQAPKIAMVAESKVTPLYLTISQEKTAFTTYRDARDSDMRYDKEFLEFLKTMLVLPEDGRKTTLMLTLDAPLKETASRMPFIITSLDGEASLIDPEYSLTAQRLFFDLSGFEISYETGHVAHTVTRPTQWAKQIVGAVLPVVFTLESPDLDTAKSARIVNKFNHMSINASDLDELMVKNLKFYNAPTDHAENDNTISVFHGSSSYTASPTLEKMQSHNTIKRELSADYSNSEKMQSDSQQEPEHNKPQDHVQPVAPTHKPLASAEFSRAAAQEDDKSFNFEEWSLTSKLHNLHVDRSKVPDGDYELWVNATRGEIQTFYENVDAKYRNSAFSYHEAMDLYEGIVLDSFGKDIFPVQSGTVTSDGTVKIGNHEYGQLADLDKMFSPQG